MKRWMGLKVPTARDFSANAPLYQQIADHLEKMLAQGSFPDGKLPTYIQLAEMFGVSDITIRKSMKILADKRLVSRRPKRGTVAVTLNTPQAYPEMARKRPGELRWVKLGDIAHGSKSDQAIVDEFRRLCPKSSVSIINARDVRYPVTPQDLVGSADVLTMNPLQFEELVRDGVLAELEPTSIPGLTFEGVYPVALAAGRQQGRQWGLPRMLNPTVVYLNQSVLRENRIPAPTAPWTWDDFVGLLGRLPARRRREPLYALGLTATFDSFWGNLLHQRGVSFHDERNHRFVPDVPAMRAAVREALRILAAVPRSRVLDVTRCGYELFCVEHGTRLASFFGGPVYTFLMDRTPDEWLTLPMPSNGSSLSCGVTYLLGVHHKTSAPSEARQLLGLIAGPYGQRMLARTNASFPAYREAGADFRHPRVDATGLVAAAENCRTSQAWQFNPLVSTLVRNYMGPILQGEIADTDDFCDQLARILNLLPRADGGRSAEKPR